MFPYNWEQLRNECKSGAGQVGLISMMNFSSCFGCDTQEDRETKKFLNQKIVLVAVLLLLMIHSCYTDDTHIEINNHALISDPLSYENGTDIYIPHSGSTRVSTMERSNENLDSKNQRGNVTTIWTADTYRPKEETESFFININECGSRNIFQFSGLKGVIYGKSGGETYPRSVPNCVWSVEVPTGYVVSSYVRFLLDPCFIDAAVTVILNSTRCSRVVYYCKIIKIRSATAISGHNQQSFFFHDHLQNVSLTLEFEVHFEAVEESVLYTLPVVFTSPVSGYVMSYGFDDSKQYPCGTNATAQITAPDGHVMMISFPKVHLDLSNILEPGKDALSLYKVDDKGSLILLKRLYGLQKGPVSVENNVLLRLEANRIIQGDGFHMLFTFHPSYASPRRLDSGLWDCSLPLYNTFKQHLECNLESECQGGEDEGPHCPYSSAACNGLVAAGDKCYRYIERNKMHSWDLVDYECIKLGGTLASMKSKDEWNAFLKLFTVGKSPYLAMIGLKTSNINWPKYYKYVLKWADDTISYETNTTQDIFDHLSRKSCGFYDYYLPLSVRLLECASPGDYRVVCEYDAHLEKHARQTTVPIIEITLSFSAWMNTQVSITPCPSGHVTHSFMSCDPECFCGKTGLPLSCQTTTGFNIFVETQMFTCEDHLATVPYSFVCNFRPDCLDGSDENFCKHDHNCREFTCRNGQCISYTDFCDLYQDCWDGSDEDCMRLYFYKYPVKIRLFPPAVVYFDGEGEFYQAPIGSSVPCPQTHFRCAGESAYCLPVYVRCNGVYDCPSHEDEEDCQQYTCPGFYRCRASRVCVHPDNVCDGWPQCPQHDDETFCGLNCPTECFCQGLAFVCKKIFPVEDFPEMRYLDGSHSGMKMEDLSSNVNLVWLSLASCELTGFTPVKLPNLQALDFSDNYITSLDFSSFIMLTNLKKLVLARNPIVNLLNSGFPSVHKTLENVDLTQTFIKIFDSQMFSNFSNIKVLNMSFGHLQAITDNRFVYLPSLRELDFRNNPLGILPREVFKNAKQVNKIFTDNYKLCCQQNLPDSFETGSCFAPVDEISSCDDLLRSDVYRVFLWLFCVLSIVGNAGGFMFRQILQKTRSASGFNVFVTNLSVADFLMGVYLSILGVADETYRSIYLWHDLQWRDSTTCKVAGFLSFMSSEVSTLIICLITIDRCIVLRFPFSKIRFERWSAWWACGLAWAVGFTLAAVPLLPFFSDWDFYGQYAICLPLPILRKIFKGRSYSFGVTIIFNMVLFVFIALGQICIYFSVQTNSIKEKTTKKSKDIIIARRLATVVVSDFLCWFPMGMLSIMANLGISIPSEACVAMAIFVLPLNSALNPFLYTFNLLVEKWKIAEDEHMMRKLESELLS